MNLDNIDLPPMVREDSTADALAALCRTQTKSLEILREENKRLRTANATLGGELLDASEKRAEALVALGDSVKFGKELCHRLVSERDTVLKALTQLVMHLRNQPITSLTYFGGEAFSKSVCEAIELVTLIEGLQKAEAAKKRG